MDRLLIDDEILMRLYHSMNGIKDTLSGAGGLARNDGKAAGDGALGSQLVLFADDWRRTRNHMLEEIDSFQSMVKNVVDGFRATEKTLTDSLAPAPGSKQVDNMQGVDHSAQDSGGALQYANAHGIAGPGTAR